jgi:16S rRNA (uracil1498-N3)-methyltransferase
MRIMARRRFFVPLVRNGYAEIAGDEARHLTQVLRVEPGQVFELSDNEKLYLAQIETVRKSQVQFRVTENLPDPPQEMPVRLLVALFKFDRLELLLEKATELGVTAVHFVRTERSDKGLDKAADKRIERWKRIVLDASQQSRRLRLPELYAPVRLRDALGVNASHRLFLDENRSGVALLDAIAPPIESIAMLVGPEGGWPDRERAEAREAGWTSVSLGEHVLRAETAAIAALAVVNAVLRR